LYAGILSGYAGREALFGEQVRVAGEALSRCVGELFFAMTTIVEHKGKARKDFDEEKQFFLRQMTIAHGARDSQDNEFKQKLDEAISQIEAITKPRLFDYWH
jgi:hypothetical protein